jgi:hypothetical protein
MEFDRARRGEGASWPQISTELGIAIEQLLRVVREGIISDEPFSRVEVIS